MLVTLHRSGSMGLMGVITLKAGSNEVAEADWAKVSDHPVVKEALRKGKSGGVTIEHAQEGPPATQVSPAVDPEPMVDEPTPQPPASPPEGGRLSAKDTIELVKKMSLMELDSLEEDEERKTVLEAVEKRRAELTGDEE